jgi:hypothetical protein
MGGAAADLVQAQEPPEAVSDTMQVAYPGRVEEESTMSKEQVAPGMKGVVVKMLAAVDLGPEIEGMAGRQLRMRMVTIEPRRE